MRLVPIENELAEFGRIQREATGGSEIRQRQLASWNAARSGAAGGTAGAAKEPA